MKKIAIIHTIGLQYEGITSVIYNYCSNMDMDGLEFYFISSGTVQKDIKNKFQNLGRIYETSNRKKHTFNYCKEIYRILKKHKFDVVHIHGNSGTMMIETTISKICGIRKILVHCHNTNCRHPYLNKIMAPVMKMTSDVYLACSNEAARWLFGNSKYIVLKNSINVQMFQFNAGIRSFYRKEMKLEDCFVIGHVGHFTEQKNHDFIIDIFKHITNKEPKARLLLIGDGPYLKKIQEKAKAYKLTDKIVFTGVRKDITELYNVIDIFLLPSKWEGLPLVMLEAQASGLPLLVSDVITKEAKCTKKVFYKSLEDSSKNWAEKILEIKSNNYIRQESFSEDLKKRGFDIKSETIKLKKIYIS
ncbi:MAG: glycosyltransferase family 1 protein [Lachnospiraceae bacterium]